MKIGIVQETASGERRVAAIPETVARMVKDEMEVLVQAGAGRGAYITDTAYTDAGATIVDGAAGLYAQADVVLKINPPDEGELSMLRSGQAVVSLLFPRADRRRVERLRDAGVSSLALDMMPRITRAQSMDVLSSMSTIAGYKAVVLAADTMGRMCPMMMTAAGTLKPAAALVIGAGVAGLQAIATARRLGAVVTAIDVRPAVREQVESLGGKFVPMEVEHEAETSGGYAADLGEEFYRQEQEIVGPHARTADLIVSTALVPGRKAPVLITEQTIGAMKPGSVIVDLAATAGGNTTLTRLDETVERKGVTILGPANLPSALPVHASAMFARNVATFLREFVSETGELNLDRENDVIRGTLITHAGEIVHEALSEAPA